jgi:hypothetical protein
MPGRRDPWRWAAASLMAASALAVVLVTVRGGGAGPRDIRTSGSAVPLGIDHLAPRLHTWTWDGFAWTLRHTDPFGDGITRPSLATISRPAPAGRGPGVLAIFGTATGSQTWFWDGATWSQQAEGNTPPYTPLSATMAGDGTAGTVVLIGLQDAGSSSTWTWDGSVWNEGARAPSVDSFYGATSVLTDTASGHPIVIGDQPNQLDMIWTWNGQSWVTDGGV